MVNYVLYSKHSTDSYSCCKVWNGYSNYKRSDIVIGPHFPNNQKVGNRISSVEIFVFLGRLLRSVDWQLPTFQDNLKVPSSRVKQSKQSQCLLSWTARPVKTEPIGCPETSVTTSIFCVIFQKSEHLIYTAAASCNPTQYPTLCQQRSRLCAVAVSVLKCTQKPIHKKVP